MLKQLTVVAAMALSANGEDRPAVQLTDAARKLHSETMLVDGHNDLPWAFREMGTPSFDQVDIAKSQPKLHTDIPRLRAGGVKAQFWSVYVPSSTRLRGESLQATLEQIEFVHNMVKTYPGTFELCLTVDDIEGAVECHLETGDALLFVDAIAHGSARRTNPGNRRIAVYRYGPSWGHFRLPYRPSPELLNRLTPRRRSLVYPHGDPVYPPGRSA